MMTNTAAHKRYAQIMLEMADNAVQLANEAAEAAQRLATKANGADFHYRQDAMHLAGEQADITESYAQIAEDAAEGDFESLAYATYSALVAAADAQAIAGLEITALPLLGIFDNPLFNHFAFEDGPEYAVELPSKNTAKKPLRPGQAKKRPQQAPAKTTQQAKPKASAKPAGEGKSHRLWWTLAALVIALFLI